MDFGIGLVSALFSIPTNYITTATLVIFLHCFYDPNLYWSKKKALLLLPVFLLNALLFYVNILAAYMASGILTFLKCFIIVYDYRGNKFLAALRFVFTQFLVSAILTPALMLCFLYFSPGFSQELLISFEATTMSDMFVSIFDILLTTESIAMLANLVIGGFMLAILPYLYRKLYKPGIVISCGKRERLFLIVYPIAGFILIEVFFFFRMLPELGISEYITNCILAVCFILLIILIPIFVYSSRITAHFKYRSQYQEGYMQTELEHFRQYRQAQEETKRFRHDVKNDLLCLRGMLDAGKTEEARAYLHNLVEVAESLGEKYVTGDEILDSILTAKGATMEQNNITFHLDGVLAGGLKWKPVDICCVFANALDNAIEACQQLPPAERYISINIRTAPQFWFVRIENPVIEDFDTGLLFQQQGGYTSKADSSRHGIGTYSIRHSTETYGGIVKAECENHRFCLEIMIPQ